MRPDDAVQRLTATVRVNVVLLSGLAAALLVAPRPILNGFGISEVPVGVLGLARVIALVAGLLAAVLWGVRGSLGTPDGRNVLRLLVMGYALGAILLLGQQWSVWYGRSGVALFMGCALLAVQYGFAYRDLWFHDRAVA